MSMRDESFLLDALQSAKHCLTPCAPNPKVGAVIVKDNQPLATGTHRGPGTPHAEVDATKQLRDEQCQGATLYVTLEPCCHQGRTPPCTDLIIEKHFARVVYAHTDPNPDMQGRSAEILRNAGIDCTHHAVDAIDTFYRAYDHWWTHKKPYLTYKLAVSQDGMIAGKDKARVQLSGDAANQHTHAVRAQVDAILTTAATIQQDDPLLTARLNGGVLSKHIHIIDSTQTLDPSYQVFKQALSTTMHTVAPHHLQQLTEQLAAHDYHHVLIEAGAVFFEATVSARLPDEVIIIDCDTTVGPEGYPVNLAPLHQHYTCTQTIDAAPDTIRHFRRTRIAS